MMNLVRSAALGYSIFENTWKTGLLVIRGTTEHGTAERRNEKQRNGIFFSVFFFFFFFFFKNNKEKVNISHKIKGMRIFFILRSRSRARLSSSFRVWISRRSVTALRTCSRFLIPHGKQRFLSDR